MTQPAPKNMVWIGGGDFVMGSEEFYPEEQPVHRASVEGFWMDEHPVTAAEFRRFVKDTGHVTWAELPPDPAEYPDALPDGGFTGRAEQGSLANAGLSVQQQGTARPV